jgi:uncharacterized membrane protein
MGWGETGQQRLASPTQPPIGLFAPQCHRIRTAALTLACFGAMLATGLQQWGNARLGGFDLGIFDQAIRAYAHLHLPRSPIKNYHHEFPPDFSILGDHFSPILVLLAPLYRIRDDPRVLLVAQSALFAVGVPLVRRTARRCFADAAPWTAHRAADTCGLVYGLGWPLFMASRDGFHEVAFAVPLTLLLLECGAARRYRSVVACAVLLMCTKEDLGLAVAVYGAVLAARAHRRGGDRRGVRTGLALVMAAPLASVLAVLVFIPASGGVPGFYWTYNRLGPDAPTALVRLVTDPAAVFAVAVDNWSKVSLLLWLLVPLCLLPLRSATALCGLPLLGERLLSDVPSHWSMSHHYDAFLWPFLVVAAIEATGARYPRDPGRALCWGTAAAVGCLTLSAGLGLARITDPAHWRPAPYQQAMIDAAALVPDGATVEADNGIAPRLTSRTHTVIADRTPRGCAYVLLQTARRSFPFRSVREQRARTALLVRSGYVPVWSRDEVVLLLRVARRPVPGMRVPGPDSTPVRDALGQGALSADETEP